jgi:hypothetical protein
MEKHLGEHVKLKELKEDSYDKLEVVLEELVDLADKKNIEVDA